jgi:hypothetical protein
MVDTIKPVKSAEDKVEVSDIFRLYAGLYKATYRSSIGSQWPYQLKVLQAIRRCRTAELGGHKEKCDTCGAIRISYNSCRNRHCPKCQSLPAEKWILSRSDEILPTHYFHVVFTLPKELNPLIINNLYHQQVVYNILFKAASQTLLQLAQDKKNLGAKVGFIGILHTWGQNLMLHPHIHFLVTGGGLRGLSADNADNVDNVDSYGYEWVSARRNFLLDVKAMSGLFKKKFLDFLEESYNHNHLNLAGKIESGVSEDSDSNPGKIPEIDIDTDSNSDKNLEKLIRQFRDLKSRNWVVFCKPTMRTPQKILEYFGRYTHRVAISNRRLIKVENGRVFFQWKDYKDRNKVKIMSLEAVEFIRRFLLHVLPKKFVKIRYYGIYGNRNRKETIQRCQTLLAIEDVEGVEDDPGETQSNSNPTDKKWWEILYERKGIDITLCPFCQVGHMEYKEKLLPVGNNSPPDHNSSYNDTRGPPGSVWRNAW